MKQHHTEVAPDAGVVFHPLANIFPWLDGAANDGLREDIRLHGVREPIVFMDGAILDGRNRYMCARDLGIAYPRREFGSDTADGNDPLAFVISLNLTRRHLTESQRASIAARLANMSVGNPAFNSANLPNSPDAVPLSVQAAAKMMNVSERSVTTARKVHDEAPAEIVRLVDEGRLSVSLAAQVADLPEAAQAEIVASAPDDVREAARMEVKKAFVANNSGNNEWYTPADILDSARAVLGGFDLDPASSEIANRLVRADRIFTAEDDGLSQDWPIGTIWMNPPYAQPLMGQFAAKFAQAIRAGSSGIVLVNNATETVWFQTLAQVSVAVCFPQSRIRFLDPDGKPSGAPLQGQAILYAGNDYAAFHAAFGAFGVVLCHGV